MISIGSCPASQALSSPRLALVPGRSQSFRLRAGDFDELYLVAGRVAQPARPTPIMKATMRIFIFAPKKKAPERRSIASAYSASLYPKNIPTKAAPLLAVLLESVLCPAFVLIPRLSKMRY
jgi:hypothetical protein